MFLKTSPVGASIFATALPAAAEGKTVASGVNQVGASSADQVCERPRLDIGLSVFCWEVRITASPNYKNLYRLST